MVRIALLVLLFVGCAHAAPPSPQLTSVRYVAIAPAVAEHLAQQHERLYWHRYLPDTESAECLRVEQRGDTLRVTDTSAAVIAWQDAGHVAFRCSDELRATGLYGAWHAHLPTMTSRCAFSDADKLWQEKMRATVMIVTCGFKPVQFIHLAKLK